MADRRLRQLDRAYRLEPTSENLERLLIYYARTQSPLDLFEAKPPISYLDIPYDTPYMAVNYFGETDMIGIWAPWGLDDDDCGKAEFVHPIMERVFRDAGLSYPPSQATEIDIFPDDEFFFIYFEPGTTRQHIAEIVDALCALGHPEAADASQRLDNSPYTNQPSPMDSIIERLEHLKAIGFPYPQDIIDFFKETSSPVWTYPACEVNQPLPPKITATLEAVVAPIYSLNVMRDILDSPFSQSLNLVFKGIPLSILIERAVDIVANTAWDYHHVPTPNGIYYIESVCLDLKSWLNPRAFQHPEQIYVAFNYEIPAITDIGEETEGYLRRYVASVSGEELFKLTSIDMENEENLTDQIVQTALCLPSWALPESFVHFQEPDYEDLDPEIEG